MTFNPSQPRENDGRFGSVHRGDPGQLDLTDGNAGQVHTTMGDLIDRDIRDAVDSDVDVDAFARALKDAGHIEHVDVPGSAQRNGFRLTCDSDTFHELAQQNLTSEARISAAVSDHLASGLLRKSEPLNPSLWEVESGEQVAGWTADGRRVAVKVRLAQRQGEFQSVTHETLDDPTEVSVDGVVYRGRWDDGGGQVISDLKEVTKFPRGVTAADRDAIVRMWERNHLNTMQAECEHQDVVGDTVAERLDGTPPCPHTGYRYGSSWLTRPADADDVVAGLAALEKLNAAGGKR